MWGACKPPPFFFKKGGAMRPSLHDAPVTDFVRGHTPSLKFNLIKNYSPARAKRFSCCIFDFRAGWAAGGMEGSMANKHTPFIRVREFWHRGRKYEIIGAREDAAVPHIQGTCVVCGEKFIFERGWARYGAGWLICTCPEHRGQSGKRKKAAPERRGRGTGQDDSRGG
jgi:hypothetical protein